jgi:transposase
MQVVLGIDVSSTRLDACILNEANKPIYKGFDNSTRGTKSILTWAQKHNVTEIVMEATGKYERCMMHACMEANMCVKIANPAQVRNFAKGIGKLAKTDKIDSFVIARFAQLVAIKEVKKVEKDMLILKELVVRQTTLKEILQAEKSRMRMADATVVASHKRIIAAIEKELACIEKEIKEVYTRNQELQRKYKILQQQKGVGFLTAVVVTALLPELGDINRKQVAALAGLAPIARDSGMKKGKRFISGGRSMLRKALYMPALVAIRHDPTFGNFYDRLVSEGKKKKVAITAVMRKLLVRLNAFMQEENMKQKATA